MRRPADGRIPFSIRLSPEVRQEIGLSAVLVIQASIMFVAVPLAGTGAVPAAWVDVLRFSLAGAAALLVSRSRLTTSIIIGAFIASFFAWEAPFFGTSSYLYRDAVTTVFDLAVAIAVAHVAYGPGRVTVPRIMGGVILYLSIGLIFGNIYRAAALLLHPSFSGLPPGRRAGLGELLNFSLGALTTAGFGDIVPRHPFLRSLVNLEAIIGQLFPATLLARLVTLHAADERRDADARSD